MISAQSMPASLARIVDQQQRLQRIEYLLDADLPQRPVVAKFVFEVDCFCVTVDGNDDSILVSEKVPTEHENDRSICVSLEPGPWDCAVGAKLTWVWILTNQQGYEDGVQLEFGAAAGHLPACFQLIALASTLEVRSVTRHA